MTEIKKENFMGLNVSVFSKFRLYKYLFENLKERKNKILYGYGVTFFKVAKNSKKVHKYAESSDLLVTDGRIFYLLAKHFGINVDYDISIPNLVNLILKISDKKRLNLYLLGAKENVNLLAIENIKKKYPNIKLVTGRNGYFTANEESDIVKEINLIEINVLLIGISSPIKERLAYEWKDKLNINYIIPCGGMIDVLAGITKQTPPVIKKLGLASFYRIIQEPSKLLKLLMKHYLFFFLRFLPIYLWQGVVKKNKNYLFVKRTTA